MKTLDEQKKEARESYREALRTWQGDMTDQNWKDFCEAKRTCMMLGVRI